MSGLGREVLMCNDLCFYVWLMHGKGIYTQYTATEWLCCHSNEMVGLAAQKSDVMWETTTYVFYHLKALVYNI